MRLHIPVHTHNSSRIAVKLLELTQHTLLRDTSQPDFYMAMQPQHTPTEEQLSPVDILSDDLWLTVFSGLDWRDLARAASTCTLWRKLAATDELWQRQWKAYHGRESSSTLSSNEMGGCAIPIRSDVESQAQRAYEMLLRRPRHQLQLQRQEDSSLAEKQDGGGGGQQHQSFTPTSIDSTVPQHGDWMEVFKRSRDLKHNWDTGRCTTEVLVGHSDYIRCLQLSGDTLVSCSGSISHTDISIRVWDVQEGTCRQVLRGHMGPIWCMMYEPTMNRIATGADDYTVRYWDSVSGNSIVMQDPDSAVRCIHMDAGSRQLVAGTEFGRLMLWDMDQLEEMLSKAVDKVVAEFDRLAQQSPRTPRSHQHHPSYMTAGNSHTHHHNANSNMAVVWPGSGLTAEELLDGRHVVADGSNHVRVVDAAEEGKAISAIQVQGGLCASTSIEPVSRIQLWDVSRNSWQAAGTLGDVDMQYANSLSFDKQIGVLVAGCGDRNVRVWDLATGQRRHLLSGHTQEIHAHQFDAQTIASAALDGQVRLWDMRTGQCNHVLQHAAPTHAFQLNGCHLVSGTWDGRVCLWDIRQGSLVREWRAHNERVWAVAMDDYHVASAGLDHMLCVRSFLPPSLNPSLAPLPSSSNDVGLSSQTMMEVSQGHQAETANDENTHLMSSASSGNFNHGPSGDSSNSLTDDMLSSSPSRTAPSPSPPLPMQ